MTEEGVLGHVLLMMFGDLFAMLGCDKEGSLAVDLALEELDRLEELGGVMKTPGAPWDFNSARARDRVRLQLCRVRSQFASMVHEEPVTEPVPL